MTQDNFLVFVLIAAVFLAGASLGRLMLRVRLARLESINVKLDQRRLRALAQLWESRASIRKGEDAAFALEIQDEIETILTEIERT